MRGQKGITLVALIITIVVLLILATVAITAMTQYDIIGNANKAAEKYDSANQIEKDRLDYYNQVVTDYNTVYGNK